MAAAGDLRLPSRAKRPRRRVDEVAALGRLARRLHRGVVTEPDPVAEEPIARRVGETQYLEELKESYEAELAEHEAWVALLAHFRAGR
ncbi:MAG: hypothetical protein JSS97_00770 [Actinobacteria bacterium]|nr:hypothetical protein [Actinomycetota bacterium]